MTLLQQSFCLAGLTGAGGGGGGVGVSHGYTKLSLGVYLLSSPTCAFNANYPKIKKAEEHSSPRGGAGSPPFVDIWSNDFFSSSPPLSPGGLGSLSMRRRIGGCPTLPKTGGCW